MWRSLSYSLAKRFCPRPPTEVIRFRTRRGCRRQVWVNSFRELLVELRLRPFAGSGGGWQARIERSRSGWLRLWREHLGQTLFSPLAILFRQLLLQFLKARRLWLRYFRVIRLIREKICAAHFIPPSREAAAEKTRLPLRRRQSARREEGPEP